MLTVEWLQNIQVWPNRPDSLVFVLVFWGFLALLAGLEAWIPAFRAPPLRSRRWETNIVLGLINGVLASLAPLSAIAAAGFAKRHDVGFFNNVDVPVWIAVAATVALYSLAGYALHVMMHKVPLFWRIHRVHHLDTHLDATTALRNHPLDYVFGIAVLAAVAIVFGLSTWALVVYESVQAIMGLMSHANLRLPQSIDRVLRLLIVTPNMHCLHHSSYQPETDSNYGGVLSIWDRLFGTYRSEPLTTFDQMVIGLAQVRDHRTSEIWWQLKSPALAIPRAKDAVSS